MVLQAMKDRAPDLHRQMAQAGTLREFVAERADLIDSQVVQAVMNDRQRRNLDRLPYQELVQEMNATRQAATERALRENLEFPNQTEPQ